MPNVNPPMYKKLGSKATLDEHDFRESRLKPILEIGFSNKGGVLFSIVSNKI